ncbi:hypothetical protein UY846_24925, partial [Escherichia coli]|nr:hypothetical protein [Escherichia coli]MDY8485055.1 hypothetical protein [Escherichia coli]MDY8526487.1 hypothetical protein [Escherichia coli]MDY8540016.1 hypothetical protein [Escherichia coli]MDY8595010.1 hypothetical protein [Escherichia coli]
MFAGKKSAQIREILINESAWEEMTCLFAPSLNRLIRCVCGKKIGPDPRNFNQRVSLGRNDLLIRTFL